MCLIDDQPVQHAIIVEAFQDGLKVGRAEAFGADWCTFSYLFPSSPDVDSP